MFFLYKTKVFLILKSVDTEIKTEYYCLTDEQKIIRCETNMDNFYVDKEFNMFRTNWLWDLNRRSSVAT